MRRILLTLSLACLMAGLECVSANAKSDSIFVRKLITEYERQQPRLERAIRKRVKNLKDTDSLYLIPTLLFKRDSQRLGYTSPEELAEWESFDITHFYIVDFVVYKTSGDTVVYDIENAILDRNPQYKVYESSCFQKLMDLIKELKPRLVFQIAGLDSEFFFIKDDQIFLYKYTVDKSSKNEMIYYSDCIEYLKANIKNSLIVYGLSRKIVH